MTRETSLPSLLISSDYRGDISKVNSTYVNQYAPLSIHCQRVSKGTLVTLSTPKDFVNLERHLADCKVPYTVLPSLFQKPYRVVLKGIDPYIDPQEITGSLERLGFTVLKVAKMTSFRTRKPLPMFLADLEDDKYSKKALTINKLCYFDVTVEEYRSYKVPPQCGKCQAYFHTTSRCTYSPRCRWCGGEHITRQCKSSDLPSSCALCKRERTANYRGCQKYQEIMERAAPRRQEPQSRKAPQKSWAKITQGGQSSSLQTRKEIWRERPTRQG